MTIPESYELTLTHNPGGQC